MRRSDSMEAKECVFCKIIEKKIPSKIVFEDEGAVAIEDVNPQAPVHILIVPKRHLISLLDIDGAEEDEIGRLFSIIPKLARLKGIAERGFRTVINSGKEAGQTVFHLHIHLLGGRPFHWPPG